MRDSKTFQYLAQKHFNDIINGAIKTSDSRCPTTFYYEKNGKLLLIYSKKIGNVWVDYEDIFMFFFNSFNLDSKELKKLLTPIIGNYLNHKGITVWITID
jgi:hypothetical protein